jgi:hypothetical protein
MKYLQKLISNLKFDELNRIIGSNRFINSCHIFRNEYSLECKNFHLGMNIMHDLNQFTLSLDFNNKTNSFGYQTCYEKKFDRILLTLRNLGQITIFLEDCKTSTGMKTYYEIKPKLKIQISFNSYTVKKLSNS